MRVGLCPGGWGPGRRDAPPGSATGWGMGPSREDPGQNEFAELNCSVAAERCGCVGQYLQESKVPLDFPLLQGRGFGVDFWGSFLASKILCWQ